MEKVFLVGERPNDEIPLWMNACDVLCLPSRREGQPCVILEALACGLPVIASSIGGIPELINDDNGILIEPRNPSALVDAIETAFQHDWDRERISKQIERSSWSRSADSYLGIFEEVLLKR